MYKRLFLSVLFSLSFLMSVAQRVDLDSLSDRMALMAARGQVDSLRPLYSLWADSLPKPVQLYSLMVLSKADGNHQRVVACIDTLETNYPDHVGTLGLVSLSELKAQALMSQSKYAEASDYIADCLRYYKKKQVRSRQLLALRNMQVRAQRFLGGGLRPRLFSLAEQNDAFALSEILSAHAAELDDFARFRAQFAQGRSLRNSRLLLQSATALLQSYQDSLSAAEVRQCLYVAAQVQADGGQWAALRDFCREQGETARANGADLTTYERWATLFASEGPLQLSAPAPHATLQLPARWPLAPFAIIGSTKQGVNVLLDTRSSHTLMSRHLAQKCGLTVSEATMQISCPWGFVEVAMALAPEFKLGSFRWTNVPIYVIMDESVADSLEFCELGCDLLSTLGAIEVNADSMTVFAPARSTASQLPNACFGSDGGLFVQIKVDDVNALALLDSGQEQTVVSEDSPFRSALTPESLVSFPGGKVPLGTYEVSATPTRAALVLGGAFLRGCRKYRLDFENMVFSLPVE